MPLSPEQQEKIKRTLSLTLQRPCAVCGGKNWEIQGDLSFFPILDPEYKMPIEGKIYPVVLVVCTSCNNTLSFSAMKMGLL